MGMSEGGSPEKLWRRYSFRVAKRGRVGVPGGNKAPLGTNRQGRSIALDEVVAAVPAAGSEKAAAHRLGLSHSTVKRHLANARSKVGAETTAQLVCA
jgi:DNA invertase Pin-like site-specific DNA recombinase